MHNAYKFPLTHIIAAILLGFYPIGALAIKHAVTASFFCLAIIFLRTMWRDGMFYSRHYWDDNAVIIALTMAAPVIAILISQTARAELDAKPYDEATRFLLAIPIYLGLRRSRIPIVTIFEYAFPIGAILAIATSVKLYGRLGGTFLNVIHYGDLALVLGFLPIFANYKLSPRPVILRILQIIGIIAGCYLLIRSGTRGGWIAVPPLMLLWLYYQPGEKRLLRMLLIFGLLMLLTGIVSYMTIAQVHQRIDETYQNLLAFANGNGETSIGSRLQIWQAALRMFIAHPWFGLGTEGYRHQLELFGQVGTLSSVAVIDGMAEVHQQVLNYAVKFGICGLIAILAVHIGPLMVLVRSIHTSVLTQYQASLMGIFLVVAFIIFGLTVEIFNLKITVTFYSLTIAALLAAATGDNQKPQET